VDDLTNIYYGKMFLPYLKHYHLRCVWKKFINRSSKQQLLEEAATFIAQWMQPEKDISYSHIKRELDNIAKQVMNHLEIRYPMHPIFSANTEQFSDWKDNNIDEDQWDNENAKRILDSLCLVLHRSQFSIKCLNILISVQEHHFIDWVSCRLYVIIKSCFKDSYCYCYLHLSFNVNVDTVLFPMTGFKKKTWLHYSTKNYISKCC